MTRAKALMCRFFESPAPLLPETCVSISRSLYTFFQAVTESVNRSQNVTLVAMLPEGQVHAGGEGGMTALDTLESILERVNAVSIPLEVDNAFKVVRRRLFSGEIDEKG